MVRLSRSQIAVASACALLALSAVAMAQPRTFQCKASETQAECHGRLRCKADEELEDCQKRLAAAAKADAARQQSDEERSGREREAAEDRREQAREDREDRRAADDDRGERSRGERSRGERSRGERSRGERRRGRESSSRSRQRGGRSFEANKTFGLGLELGEPTGLTGKYFVSPSGALDFGIGAIYSHYYYGDGLHLYLDYLWHPVSLASTPAFELPFYVGVGLRYWDFEYCDRQVCGYDGAAVGVRVPLGIAFDFNNTPLDIFLQLVPVIDFLDGDYYDRYGDRAHVGVDLSLGLRYWFN